MCAELESADCSLHFDISAGSCVSRQMMNIDYDYSLKSLIRNNASKKGSTPM
jgi:hypothetical protein